MWLSNSSIGRKVVMSITGLFLAMKGRFEDNVLRTNC